MFEFLLSPLFHAACSLFHSPRTLREKWLQWLIGAALAASLGSTAALAFAFSLYGRLSIILSAFAAILVSAALAGWCAYLLDLSIRSRNDDAADVSRLG